MWKEENFSSKCQLQIQWFFLDFQFRTMYKNNFADYKYSEWIRFFFERTTHSLSRISGWKILLLIASITRIFFLQITNAPLFNIFVYKIK